MKCSAQKGSPLNLEDRLIVLPWKRAKKYLAVLSVSQQKKTGRNISAQGS
jgi:hypothetical protein